MLCGDGLLSAEDAVNSDPEKSFLCIESLGFFMSLLLHINNCHCIFIIQALRTTQVLNSKCCAVSLSVSYFCKLLNCLEYLHSEG